MRKEVPVIMLSVVFLLMSAPAQAEAQCKATPFGEVCPTSTSPKEAPRCVATPFGETCSQPPENDSSAKKREAAGSTNAEPRPRSKR